MRNSDTHLEPFTHDSFCGIVKPIDKAEQRPRFLSPRVIGVEMSHEDGLLSNTNRKRFVRS